MSCILYYSNYCQSCSELLQRIGKSKIKEDLHFINLDNRVKKNSAMYVVLENGQEVLLPPTITKVPALLLLNRGHQVIFGSDIINHLEPREIVVNKEATQSNGEPLAYMLGASGFGVASDNYSFLDQNSEELSAKGDGGLRQQHHYVGLNDNSIIETPPDNYNPDKIVTDDMEKYKANRDKEINMPR